VDDRQRSQLGGTSGGDQPASGSPRNPEIPATSIVIPVTVSDSLADVLGRLSALPRGAARFAIPTGSALFLTASEFRALKEASDHAGIDTTIETEDPLRRQLAAMFGLRAVQVGAPPGPRPMPPTVAPFPPATLPPPTPLIPGGSTPAAPYPLTPPPKDVTTPSTRRSPLRRQHRQPEPAVGDSSSTTSWTPPQGATPSARPLGEGSSAHDTLLNPSTPAGPGKAPERRGLTRRTVAIILASILAVVLLVAAGLVVAAMTLATADVVIELRQQPLTTETTFRVVAEGGVDPGGDEIAIPGRYVTLDVNVEQTVPATGTANVGITPASGVVQLANPEAAAVDIPAGTTATGDGGVEFRFITDVSVPAATDDAPGQAQAEIEAMTLGTVGNLGPGELSGILESGVFFSNRLTALAGGADVDGTVVSETDLDSARLAASEAAPGIAVDRFAETLQSGLTPIPSTFQLGEPKETFDVTAGAAAEDVTIRAVFTVTALTYDDADLDSLVRERIVEDLGTTVPSGFVLDESTIRISAPETVARTDDDPNGPLVSVTVTARAIADFTPEDAAALVERLSGESHGDAADTLRDTPEIATFSVRHAPDWLARGMPNDADRIEIRIDD